MDHPTIVEPGHSEQRRLRAAVIGAGGHSYRNIRPALAYTPVEIVAVCDLDLARAAAYASSFGGCRTYSNHLEMLAAEDLECVFVIAGFDRDGRLLHAPLAADCLGAGVSVWVEKPAVADRAEIDLIRQAMEVGAATTYGVGFKKAFATANSKARALIDAGAIGEVQSITLRYPQSIPAADASWDDWLVFLDHICHPLAVLQLAAGKVDSLSFERAPHGDGVVLFRMASGAIASLHLPSSLAMHGIKERTEISGTNGTIWVENNTRVTTARRPEHRELPPYGRGPTFATDEMVMSVWEPEFSLGQLYNKAIFLLGYVGELRHFTQAVINGHDVSIGGLDWAAEGIRVFDAIRSAQPGDRTTIREAARP